MTGSITGWVKLLVKQFAFSRRIKRVCKKKGFALKKNGDLWWLGKNKSGKYNFTVIRGNESYCVKLIGVRSKRILFGFINEESYEIKDYTFALPVSMDGFEYEAKKKEPYCFEMGAMPCIVMVPDSVKVTVRSQTVQAKRIEIGNCDMAPEGKFFYGERFLDILKKK